MRRRSYSRNPDLDECLPLSENPAFEGTVYESFEQNPEAVSAEEQLKSNDPLLQNMPSKIMRRMRGVAPLETVRATSATRPALDIPDGGNVQGPSDLRSAVVVASPDIMLDDGVGISGIENADIETIRDMTTTMDRKKAVRNQVQEYMPEGSSVSAWQHAKFKWSLRWKNVKDGLKDSFSTLHIWEGHLKEVQGVFGTGVCSYFTFLRWLLYLNLLVCILTIAFLLIPQVLHRHSSKDSNATFTGLELLTGEGWFMHTEMYYGQYTNLSIQVGGSLSRYVMPYAYLFVGSGYTLLCILVLAVSMASSYNHNYVVGSGPKSLWISHVFCSWDFAITDSKTADLKMRSVFQELVESLEEDRKRLELSCCKRFIVTLVRFLTNICALAIMAGSVYLILYVSNDSVKRGSSSFKRLLPAITISGINLVVPSAFRLLASIESYHSVKLELMMTLGRTIVLKLASLVVYVVALHKELTRREAHSYAHECWEVFVGAAFYKLIIIDFLTIILYSFAELIRKLLSTRVQCFRDRIGPPGFDISKNVLDVIYSQGVCWLGTFYCPLLPVIVVMKFTLLFYLKKVILTRLCRPSMRPFKASKMLLLFLVLLSLMLILAMVVIGYVIMNDGALRPSAACGPFRSQASIYDIVHKLIENDLPGWLKEAVGAVSSLSVITALVILMSLFAYYFRMRKQSSEKKIKILKHQLVLAGQDKRFLIMKLRALLRDAPRVL